MNDDALDSMLNSISALELNRPEVSNGTQDDFNYLISDMVKQQMEYLTLQKTEVQQMMEIDSMATLKSMGSVVGTTRGDTYASRPYGYTTSINNEIGTNQSYFESLRRKTTYANKTNRIIKNDLDIKTLVADLLKFCSDEEIDELVARITSDSEYLSRKGYNSINLKGD